MKSYVAFTKKEFVEIWRTYKLMIMVTVFVLLGMMNPITAKLTPELLKTFMPEGMNIVLPEPAAIDSWAQFFKNIPSLGIIVFIIIFSGMISVELSRGTLVNMLTKGLSRRVVLLSKFTMAALVWSLSYLICFGISYGYTQYFWPSESVSHLGLAVIGLWVYGIFLLTIMLLGGVIFKGSYGGLLFTGGIMVVLMLLNIIPKFQKFNPNTLSSQSMALLTGKVDSMDVVTAISVSGILLIILMVGAMILFDRRQV